MKKILIIILSLCGVAQAQIVGGFLPINSTKSFTAASERLTGNLVVVGTGSIGSTFTVTSTEKLGSAVLTGGNTGTVAVLSDAVFPVTFEPGVISPADATTYYFGNTGVLWAGTNNAGQITVPYNCTLVSANINMHCGGVSGTTETATLSINGTTNYTLSTAVSFSTGVNNLVVSGLSQSFSANDAMNIKILTPTWATNPTNVYAGITLWFVRRQ